MILSKALDYCDDFKCPYCNKSIQDDSDYICGDGEPHSNKEKYNCPHCNEKILVSCKVTWAYKAEKVGKSK